jgi:hypothetical protein
MFGKKKNEQAEVVEDVVEEAAVAESITEQEVVAEIVEDEKEQLSTDGLVTFKVLHPVLGYKAGDTFEATMHEVRFQLKHKSVEVA